ncbi:MAG: HAD-IC family P-type ATPase, partial [Pseudomonadota bacterium]
MAATSRLFDRGVLVKAADGLERLSACDTVVFDKTGTLTEGAMQLGPLTDQAEAQLPSAARMAATSTHPYSRALTEAARSCGAVIVPFDDVDERPGQGLIAKDQNGSELRLGSAAFCGVSNLNGGATSASLWFRSADSALVAFPFVDTLKADAIETITRLKKAGFSVEVLSGDRPESVSAIADQVGVETWKAAVKPADKVAHLRALKDQGRTVVMVGDGLNDAPSLAAAHASLSPAEAAEISQTAADAILQGGTLAPVADALATGQMSQR